MFVSWVCWERAETGAYLFGRVSDVRGGQLLALLLVGAEGEVPQLVPLVENVVADSKVDEGRKEDADPDGQVIQVNPQRRPLGPDPAPQLRLVSSVANHLGHGTGTGNIPLRHRRLGGHPCPGSRGRRAPG